MSQPIVEVRNLHKTFEESGAWPWSERRSVPAVRGVDFVVNPGEVVALVGQSGSGKTTVSRIVLGLETATGGGVWIEGQRWDDLPESKRRPRRVDYQYVPQDAMAALDPQQTALEHVSETLRVLGGLDTGDAKEQGLLMLSRLGLGSRAGALPREMSGGEQRRVTLARVLALEPRLVVADEPTSGLDPERREEVLQALVGNLPKDAGCIIVTHDMSEATQWCDRILVMLHGRVVEELNAKEDAPQHPYSKVLFDPWAGPLPDFDKLDDGESIPNGSLVCHDEEVNADSHRSAGGEE
jgi:ABC-type glutathione transport system ATPase component